MAPYDNKYLSAGVWGNSSSEIPYWEVVTDGTIQTGDVAAYAQNYSNATGHMGIMNVTTDRKGNSQYIIIYAGSSKYNYIVGSNFTNWQSNARRKLV
jgi:hypothetical protein